MTKNSFAKKLMQDIQNRTGMTSKELNHHMKMALNNLVNNREEVMANYRKMLEKSMPQGRTMHDIDWVESEHKFAEAAGPAQSKNVMLDKDPENGLITVAQYCGNEWLIKHLPPKWLAPTGRRYVLQEEK